MDGPGRPATEASQRPAARRATEPRIVKVQTLRRRVRRSGPHQFDIFPEIRLTNFWLYQAGFDPGDFVKVEIVPMPDKPGESALVITLHRKAQPEDPIGYMLGKPLKPLG